MSKLFKYNLNKLTKSMGLYYILALVSAILFRIVHPIYEANISLGGPAGFALGLADIFCGGLFISMAITTLINQLIRSWLHYRENMFGRSAYLTHALPLKTSTIFGSWWLACVASTAITVLVVGACLVIGNWSTVVGDGFLDGLLQISEILNIPLAMACIGLIVLVLLEFVTILTCGLFAINLGHRFNDKKVLASIVICAAIYSLLQTFIFLAVFSCAYYNDEIASLFQNNSLGFSSLSSVVILASSLYILFATGLSFGAMKSLDKGVNVE